MKQGILFLLSVFVFSIVFLIPQSYATIYTGSLQYTPPFPPDNNDGLNVQTPGLDWPTYTVSMSWTVTNEDASYPGYPWKYTYTFGHNGSQGDISHLIIETSDDFTSADMTGLTGAIAESIGLQTSQSGNPGIPEDIYGIRLNPLAGSPFTMTWSFWSNRQPVWGDFYTKDGGHQGEFNYAYNYNNTNGIEKGFTINDVDPTDPASNGSIDYHILRPDTVPEPATLGLILLGSMLLLKKHRE